MIDINKTSNLNHIIINDINDKDLIAIKRRLEYEWIDKSVL